MNNLDPIITIIYIAISCIKFTGTERCNEALLKLKKKYDVVVNIQGDEPLIEPDIIDGVVKLLQVSYNHTSVWYDGME